MVKPEVRNRVWKMCLACAWVILASPLFALAAPEETAEPADAAAGRAAPPPPENSPRPEEKPQPIAEIRTERADDEDAPPPPLGLGDVDALLQRAISLLAPDPATTLTATPPTAADAMEEAARCISLVERYLARVADSLAYLTRYEWTALDKPQRFSPGETQDRFPKTPRTPIRGTTAIRISVTGGDCYMKELAVLDAEGNSHFYRINRWARAALPKREVVFLREPTALVGVDLYMDNRGEAPVRALPEAGAPDRPEYAREIALLCAESLRSLERKGAADAIPLLMKARQRLREFRVVMSRAGTAR